MENASKALIIAGAILLAIAIIGLGMAVFNMADNASKQTGLDEFQIQSFNGKFTKYEGANKSGATVKTLCNDIITHNNSNLEDYSKQVNLVETAATGTNSPSALIAPATITAIKNKILTGKTYTVTISYDSKTGLVCEVGVVQNK